MLESDAESNGKLPHLFIPSKTATLVHDFAVENLPLGRTADLVHEFCSEKPAIRQNPLMIMMMIHSYFIKLL